MNLKLNRQTFTTSAVVSDTSIEQAVELDLILPDYYPDIFRILRCKLCPVVVAQSVNGDKLSFELCVLVKLMYLTENSNCVNTIEQKLTFTKNVELTSNCTNPVITITPRCDYVNCRVVNRRRLDIRGAVSAKCKVVGEKTQTVLEDADGEGIQLKKEQFTYPAKKLCATKRVTVIEDLEIGQTKAGIDSVVRSDAHIISSENRIVNQKLVVKGLAEVTMLYQSSESDAIESMKFDVPFSQVIDMDGIDEHYDAICDITVSACNIIPKGAGKDAREAECELVLLLCCRALRFDTALLTVDAYSTTKECKLTKNEAKIECIPKAVSENAQVKTTVTYNEGEISNVYDVWGEITSTQSKCNIEEGFINILATVCFNVMASNENGCPLYLESEVQLEHEFSAQISEDSSFEPKLCITNCVYNLISNNAVEIKADIKIGGNICGCKTVSVISEIELEDNQKASDTNTALKLYYAQADEDIWEIAKKYKTSINAIIQENELTDEKIAQNQMLLIPLVK